MLGIVFMTVAAMAAGFIVITIVGMRYEAQWAKNLSLDISFSEEQAGEGDTLYLYETIVNDKERILPSLCVKFKTSRYLVFDDSEGSSVSDYFYRNDVMSVGGFEKVRRKLRFRCERRGQYTIEGVELVGNDYFLRRRFLEKREEKASLIVYPSFVGVEKLTPLFEKNYGEMSTKVPMFEDPFEYVGVREYMPGDSMSRVNWKASARTARWQVRTSAFTAGQPVWILLNLESPGAFVNAVSMEENIRIAYSLIYYLDKRGISTTLVSNGSGGLHIAGNGRGHMAEIRRRLATIRYDKISRNGEELLRRAAEQISENEYVFFLSAAGKPEIRQQLTGLRKNGIGLTWVAVVAGGEDDTKGCEPGVEACLYRWRV